MIFDDLKLTSEGAAAESLESLGLPADVRAALERHDGGSGKVGARTFVLLPAREIADEPEVTAAVPGLVVFGTDGGAEGYAYFPRLQRGKYGRISLLAAGAHEFESLGDSFEELLAAIRDGR